MAEAVECLASDSYPGDPLALTWGGERREVEAILRRWRGPEGLGFLVRARLPDGPGETFELFYDSHADAWRVTLQ
jgi:hypothetical protein